MTKEELLKQLKKAIDLAEKLNEPKKVVIPEFIANDGDENFRKYVSAWDNGYEVEKEPKYIVKIKGICQENQWLNCEVGGDLLYFELNSSTESEKYKTNFTKQWLKDHWPEYDAYNNAGLLEFEEVEDE